MLSFNVLSTTVPVRSIGPQTSFSFGSVTEFMVDAVGGPEGLADDDWSKVLVYNGRAWFVATKNGLRIYDDAGADVDVSSVQLAAGSEELRNMQVLQCLNPAGDFEKERHDFQVLHVGVSSYCDDCWTNKGCKVQGCSAGYCCWSAGYVCKEC